MDGWERSLDQRIAEGNARRAWCDSRQDFEAATRAIVEGK